MHIGLNLGNSSTKVYAGPDRQAAFPSVLGEGHKAQFSINGNDRRCMLEPAFVYGTTALEESRNPQRSPERADWVASALWRNLALAALSEVTTGSIEAQVVTGLPVGPEHQAMKAEAQAQLLGELTFKRDGRNAQSVKVSEVRVIPEPFGTLFDLWLTDSAKIADNDYRYGRWGVIDCGSNTINFMVVNDLHDIAQETHTHERGAWAFLRNVRARLENDLPGLRLEDHQLEQAVIAGHCTQYGMQVSLASLVSELSYAPAREVLDLAVRVFNAITLKGIVITGGFSLLLQGAMEQLSPWPAGFMRFAPEPVISNARGFYKFARLVL